MTEQPDTTAERQTASLAPSSDGSSPQEQLASTFDERPELAVGAAFAGGLLAALMLKRLAR